MSVRELAPDVYQIGLGIVNAFLIDAAGLTLIDTGTPGSEDRILEAIGEIGKAPEDVRQILVTHCHADHAGSLAALKQVTGAPAFMHPSDAALVREGLAGRRARAGPGIVNAVLFRLMLRGIGSAELPPAPIDWEIEEGAELPLPGMRVVHAPGHTIGQLAFLWPLHGGVLFAADAASNMFRLGPSILYEDLEAGRRTLRELAALEFEVACFGHGGAIRRGADGRFRRKWGKGAVGS